MSALAKDRTVPVPMALATRNLLRNARSPMLLAASLLQPVVWLLLFSQIFSGLGDTPEFRRLGYGSYLQLFVPGMLVLSMLFTALQSGLATVTDIGAGVMDKLLISPIRRSSILVGRIAADGVTMAVQAVIILGLGVLMGASWRTGWPGALALLGCAVAFGVVWSSVSNLIALRTRNAELTMVAGLFLTLPVLFLSSAFFPKPLLSGWLQTVADLNPAAYVIQAGQELMSIGNDWGIDLRMLGAIAGAAIVLLPASVAAFRAATRRQD